MDKQIHINKAINYIVENFTQPPNLADVAKISGFSKFHFHRLFKEFTGETLNQFIKRIRLERSAFYLYFLKEKTITDVALSCGFSSSQNFASAFKKHFKTTPKQYKQNRVCQGVLINDPEIVAKYKVELIFIDSFYFVYERRFGAYYNTAFDENRAKALDKFSDKIYIGLFLDDPTITDDKKCRYDYGYLSNNSKVSKELKVQNIEANRYIVLSFIKYEDIDSVKIWTYLFTNWLPRHGYAPNSLMFFESIDKEYIKFHIPIKTVLKT